MSLGIADVFQPEGRVCVWVCTHGHLSLSRKVLGRSLDWKQSRATAASHFPIIQTNERRARAWIIENMDSPRGLSFACVYLAPGMLMLIIKYGLD